MVRPPSADELRIALGVQSRRRRRDDSDYDSPEWRSADAELRELQHAIFVMSLKNRHLRPRTTPSNSRPTVPRPSARWRTCPRTSRGAEEVAVRRPPARPPWTDPSGWASRLGLHGPHVGRDGPTHAGARARRDRRRDVGPRPRRRLRRPRRGPRWPCSATRRWTSCSSLTPPRSHPDMRSPPPNAGKHVLIEKPMANTVADCDRIIEAARRNDVRLGDRVPAPVPEVAAGRAPTHRRRRDRRRADDPGHRADRGLRRARRQLEGRPERADRLGRLGRARLRRHALAGRRRRRRSPSRPRESYTPEPPPEQSSVGRVPASQRRPRRHLADLRDLAAGPRLGAAVLRRGLEGHDRVRLLWAGSSRAGRTAGRRSTSSPRSTRWIRYNPVRIQAYSDELADVLAAIARAPRAAR